MKKPNFHQNEQGSAILIVLGILTLVLTLALVFVATSRNARAIATAGADYANAGLIAESAAARAQAVSYYVQSVIMDNIPTGDTSVNNLVYDHQPFSGAFNVTVASHLTSSNPGGNGNSEDYRLVRVQHLKGRKGASFNQADVRQNGYVLYTHDKNNKSAEHVLYSLLASTNLGKYIDDSTFNFKDKLSQANYNSNFTYQNILDEDGHVQSRYAFLMIPEGPKFNVNRMVLAGGDGVNNIPEVLSGEMAKPDDFVLPGSSDFPVGIFQSPDHSFFAITGYEYNDADDPGKITGLNDSGAYDEADTLQYGLHPQELRIAENVKDLANKLELQDDVKPPQWFNYDNLLAINKSLWDPGTQLRNFWSLYTLESGLDDREVLYHGTEANIEQCSNDSPKINLAFPKQTSWDTISTALSAVLETGISVSTANYLSTNFQDILGSALDSDTDSHVVFKDDDNNDITAQVFANLVDFCDSDSVVTYEATVGTGGGAQRLKFDTNGNDISDVDIKLCGTEKTPAVIGVGLELTNCNRTATNGSGTWSVAGSGTTSYNLRVVLQNYLNDPVDLPKNVRVFIKGNINVWYAGYYNNAGTNIYQFHGCTHSVDLPSGYAPLHATPSTFDFSEDAKPFVIDKTFTLAADQQLGTREVDDTTFYDNTGTFELNLSSASNVSGKLERAGVWLQVTDILVMTADDADELMDIAYANGDSHTILWTKNAMRIVMPWTQYRPLAWAVAQDPRCNHKNWQWYDALEGSGYNWTVDATVGIATSAAFGMQDKLRAAALKYIQTYCKNGNLSTAKDLEPLLDFTTGATGTGVVQTPNTFSTAFIPNAPITSLWQLGAVSRGLPAQTINLKKYGGPKKQTYADGDAWLLDYFKLNELDPTASFPGKFNPNCFHALAYRYLFANIPANPDPNETEVYQPGRLVNDSIPIKRNEMFYTRIDKNTAANVVLEGKLFKFANALNFETLSNFNASGSLDDYPTPSGNKDDDVLAPAQAAKQSWSPVEAFYNFVELEATPKYYDRDSGAEKGANDRLCESLIGCTAGLLSTRYEYFTVFAVGQNVKYIGQTHTNSRDDYLPLTPNPSGNQAQKDFYNQLANPVKINANSTVATNASAANREEGWYSILSTQMRLMTIERDCWFNKMRIVRTQLY